MCCEHIAAGGPPRPPYAERVRGAVLLGDVRGFTQLTERMAAHGPDGVETLTAAMNRYFGGMIDSIGEHGGEVVNFAGDALLALWPEGEQELPHSLAAAADCALELAAQDADVAAGLDARLQVRLAVAAGELSGLQVGRPSRMVYSCLMGAPLERVAEAIDHAGAGEVAIDTAGWALLRDRAAGRPVPDGMHVLTGVRRTQRFQRTGAAVSSELTAAALAPYIAPSVLAHEAAVQDAWMTELRRVTAIFVALPDLVEGVDLERLQTLVIALQGDFERHEAQLNQITVDNKGASLLAATGLPPHAHADDPERGVRTGLAVAATLERRGSAGTAASASRPAAPCAG